jgi:hypothetical protein
VACWVAGLCFERWWWNGGGGHDAFELLDTFRSISVFSSFGGVALLLFANRGKIARYSAAEQTPVVKDVARDLGPTVTEVATAARKGWSAGDKSCPKCNTMNDANAKFCDACGTAFGGE